MNFIKNYFKDWTKFEVVWLILSSLTMIGVSIALEESTALGDKILALISGITGILGVVLAAKGKLSTYFFATINVALYAFICYEIRLYGEVMLNALYYLPMNIIGFFLWKRHKDQETNTVETRNLPLLGVVILLIVTGIAIVAYWKLLAFLGGDLPLIDSTTTVISVVALVFQVIRYSETWLLWIIVNVVSVVMWSIKLIGGDGPAVIMIVMWVAYLINSVYGFINWRKIAREHKAA